MKVPRYAGVYLHKDTLILHAMGQLSGGGLVSIEPVIRLLTSAAEGDVGRALRQSLGSFRPDMQWSRADRHAFLKATGFRSWKQLESGARSCWIREEDQEIVFTPLSNGGSRGDEKGFQPFGAKEIRCEVRAGENEIGAALTRALAASLVRGETRRGPPA